MVNVSNTLSELGPAYLTPLSLFLIETKSYVFK